MVRLDSGIATDGFRYVGEVTDPEDGVVSRFEYPRS